MVPWMLAFPVTRVPIPGGEAPPQGPLIASIGPEPRHLGFSDAGGEHADRRVVREDRFGRQDMATNGVSEGFPQGGSLGLTSRPSAP